MEKDPMVSRVVEEVLKRVASGKSDTPTAAPGAVTVRTAVTVGSEMDLAAPIMSYGLTEFVGLGPGDTIGLVIANLDNQLHEQLGFDKRFKSIGIIGSRTGAGPQLMAADEGIKATNTEIVRIELPRDCKGGAGHGSLIIFGAVDVSDARRAVEVTLKDLNQRTFGDVYANSAGHLEFQYSARGSYVLEKAFACPFGKAFGLILGAPAAIGVVICDVAVKAADVEILGYGSPQHTFSLTNEMAIWVTGDSGAVRQSVIAARDAGLKLLSLMGEVPKSLGTAPYI